MEFNLLSGILALIAIIAIISAIYTKGQYKSKKKEGLSLEDEISEYKEQLKDREEVIKKKVEEINSLDTNIKDKKEEIKSKEEDLKELLSLQKNSKQLESNVSRLKDNIATLEKDIKDKSSNQTELEKELRLLRGNISLYSPTAKLIEVGFYEEPKYLYETSDRYKSEIQIIRDKIKALIRDGKAINAPESIAIIDDPSSSRKAIQGQIKIMLKAFNIETDLLLANLKPSNFAKTMERIE
ncbi:MAG: DUF4041 domain-containing protein, partial [Campylobacterales bacterium]|nr:DUF4041 domain-containing protein [Campylobacterales bacterium]